MTKKQRSITFDEETDGKESTIMSGFQSFSPLPLLSTNSPSSLSDNTEAEDSFSSTQPNNNFDWGTRSFADYSGSNMRDNVDITLISSQMSAQLLGTVDDVLLLDTDLLQVQECFESAVGNSPSPLGAPEVLDFPPSSVAPHTYPTSSYDVVSNNGPSSLGGIIIDHQDLDRQRQQLDQEKYQSMLQSQQSSIPHLDYQMKKDVPSFDTNTSQLHIRSNMDQKINFSHPTRLSIPTDDTFLDPVHNFLRSTCIEVFVSSNEYNSGQIGRGSKSNLVGLRCAYCKHIPKRERAKQSVSFPSKTANICESVRNFQRTHLEACEHIPDQIKTTYKEVVSQTYRKVPLKYAKVYVAEAASEIGIVQTPEGLIFGAPPNTSGKPSEKLEAIMSVAKNPTAFKHLHDVIFPKVDDRLKKLKFSHIASENTLQVIANCRKAEAAFVCPSDFPTLSDFCFVLYHQFIPCRPPKTALSRRKTKPEKWDTLSGLCCKHCSKAHPGKGHHKGKYFPLDLKALHHSSSSFAHNVTVHVMTCQHVPSEVKDAMEELQRLAAEHGVTTKRGAKQRFMKTLWERMANYYPARAVSTH